MLYLKCPKELSEGNVPYIKILAGNEKGLSLIKKAKEISDLPIITRHAERENLTEKGKALYDFECSTTDKFALFSKNVRPCGLEEQNSLKRI